MAELTLYVPDNASIAVIQCSPPSWAAHIVLEEKRASYALVKLAFDKGEHRTPQMLERNPRGTIPVLVDGDIVLHETFAILEYLNFSLAEPGLMPSDIVARARTLVRYHESAHLKTAGMALFAYLMRTAGAGVDASVLRTLGAAFDAETARWEAYAEAGDLPSDPPTLASIVVFVYLAAAAQLGAKLPPALAEFVARMRGRGKQKIRTHRLAVDGLNVGACPGPRCSRTAWACCEQAALRCRSGQYARRGGG